MMKLRELMTQQVRTCTPESQITDAASIMADLNCGAVPIVQGKRLVGMVTDRDIVLRAVAGHKDINACSCGECMTQPVTTGTPEMDCHEAAQLMAQRQIRRLPIVEGDQLCGIVALGDLATVDIHVDEAGEALSTISTPSHPGSH